MCPSSSYLSRVPLCSARSGASKATGRSRSCWPCASSSCCTHSITACTCVERSSSPPRKRRSRSRYGAGTCCATIGMCSGGTSCQQPRSSPGSLRQSAIGSARPKSPLCAASTTAAGVVSSSSPVGSKLSASSSEKRSSPSVEAAAHERPSGAKRTQAQRTARRVTRSLRRARLRGVAAEAPPASSSSASSSRSCVGPASVRCDELRCIRTPSSAALLERTYLRSSVRSSTL
mmetsp:Transcript_48512/g.156174  ORF Transcript_48512/g.156174 Transcript_48512/m.156174 type:complete len:232 (+) Transcript_48512:275-970(+)